MKTILVTFLLICVGACYSLSIKKEEERSILGFLPQGWTKSIFSDTVKNKLEELKGELSDGMNVTTPINVQDKVFIDNLFIKGIEFNIDDIEGGSGLSFALNNLNLSCQQLIASGNYEIANISLPKGIQIYGKGAFQIILADMYFHTVISLTSLGGNFIVKDLKEFGLSVGTSDVRMEGLLGGGEVGNFLNDVLSNLIPDLVKEMSPELTGEYKPQLIELINYLLTFIEL